ncbi:hypothetical protein Ccrd_015907 [Cynara cardunculus var. scolymus]|uniref:Uncharacterized protein n=1 Tax=Cynara cardunculus var. scolymus TaxID=59895 RepID=A0A103YAU6_CYNCS|nr:hypothetical protein Ccrd_015907 [Cynara cardunculus var. scolymus]
MARRALIKAVSLEELWRTSVDRTSFSLYLSRQKFQTPISSGRCRCKIITNVRDCCSERRIDPQINCSRDENLSSSSSVVAENSHEPPQEVDLQIVSDTSKTEGRVGQTTNMVFGGTVNTYPSVRRFTAIGIGGDDFVQSMVGAVESVIQHSIPQVHVACNCRTYRKIMAHVKQRVSSGGKYVSVNIGPVQVISREQM